METAHWSGPTMLHEDHVVARSGRAMMVQSVERWRHVMELVTNLNIAHEMCGRMGKEKK